MAQNYPGAGWALIVVDVQEGFEDPVWGRRNNLACDHNIQTLVDAWRSSGGNLIYVRHDSKDPDSPLHAGTPGNKLKSYLTGTPDLLVTKSVNSSFHGTPDLDGWLRTNGITGVVVCGITTNHCCETTARVGGNLGYNVTFALDATHTFDRAGPDGTTISADALTRVTAANLHGEFARVVTTANLLSGLSDAAR
jgi:nicotinamidase-related amidase